jgi:hypothetical protein
MVKHKPQFGKTRQCSFNPRLLLRPTYDDVDGPSVGAAELSGGSDRRSLTGT